MLLGLVIYVGGGCLFFVFLEHVLIVPGLNEKRDEYNKADGYCAREPATSAYTNLCLIRDQMVIKHLLRSMDSGSMSTFL
ncbi:hypothetical protein HY004_00105 [Candidatus Saccharibacteria bacterium]|nr:hypothetical protein [Candidatus Saccharibacteria bacterium]